MVVGCDVALGEQVGGCAQADGGAFGVGLERGEGRGCGCGGEEDGDVGFYVCLRWWRKLESWGG